MNNNGKRYAVIVGISSYGDARQKDLRFTTNDAEDMYSVLLEAAGFAAENVSLFCDDPSDKYRAIAKAPTRSDILSRVQSVTSQANENDLVLFFFAGHGAEISGSPYLITNDTRMNVVKSTALDVTEMNGYFMQSKALNVVRFFDACRSSFAEARLATEPMSKGFADALFTRSKGWLTFSACSSGEMAFEHPDLNHGVFTRYLCDGIRGAAKNDTGQITIDRLIDYVKQSVANWCQQQGFLQTPHVVADLSGTLVISNVGGTPQQEPAPEKSNWFTDFKTNLSSTLSAAPMDVRHLAFTTDEEFQTAATLLHKCVKEQVARFDVPGYKIEVKDPRALHDFDSDGWQAFNKQKQDLNLNKEFAGNNIATPIMFGSQEVLLPKASASIALMRFNFFYWVWYIYRCNDQGMRDNWKAQPQSRRGYYTFKPAAVVVQDKLAVQVEEIFSGFAKDLLDWTKQLREYLDNRIQPLRDSGKIIS